MHGTAQAPLSFRPAHCDPAPRMRAPQRPLTSLLPRILVAPDSFKGTYTAAEVARAIAEGCRAAGAHVVECPVADGGEGTLDAILSAVGGDRRRLVVSDALRRPIEASYAVLADGSAFVESAQAVGLALASGRDRDPERASTYGVGELIAAALRDGVNRVLVGVGGTATTDGGVGAIEAIESAGGTGDVHISVLCDVTTPFESAAALFAPQKGADPATVVRLNDRLNAVASSLPRDPRGVPMTGCAGGLSGGLWAAFNAELVPGADAVLDALNFASRVDDSDAIVVGEGCLDFQSLQGKIVGVIARRARVAGVPTHAVVGRNDLDWREISELGLVSVTEASTQRTLREAGRLLAASLIRRT